MRDFYTAFCEYRIYPQRVYIRALTMGKTKVDEYHRHFGGGAGPAEFCANPQLKVLPSPSRDAGLRHHPSRILHRGVSGRGTMPPTEIVKAPSAAGFHIEIRTGLPEGAGVGGACSSGPLRRAVRAHCYLRRSCPRVARTLRAQLAARDVVARRGDGPPTKDTGSASGS